jgi:hypothetical protein
MAFDLSVAEKWLDDTLSADSAIAGLVGTNVFLVQAPQGSPMPYLIIAYQAGADVNAIGSRAVAQPVFLVKAVGKHSDLPALRILADRIDALLQDTKVVTAGYQLRVQRETPVHYPEVNEGVEYRHMGGMYRCWVSPASDIGFGVVLP